MAENRHDAKTTSAIMTGLLEELLGDRRGFVVAASVNGCSALGGCTLDASSGDVARALVAMTNGYLSVMRKVCEASVGGEVEESVVRQCAIEAIRACPDSDPIDSYSVERDRRAEAGDG